MNWISSEWNCLLSPEGGRRQVARERGNEREWEEEEIEREKGRRKEQARSERKGGWSGVREREKVCTEDE